MTTFIVFAIIAMILILAIQIGRISDLVGQLKGEEEYLKTTNTFQARLGMVFLVLFLVLTVASSWYYKRYMLGYTPLVSASKHGPSIDFLFNLTLFFTGIVFVLTHIALFYFAYKYKEEKGRKVDFIVHDNKLEVIWTAIPAVVMTFLVIGGLSAWNEIMPDIKPGEKVIEIEATGYQFAWALRYGGKDGLLGTRNYKLIDGENPLGQDWTDKKNLDDFQPDEIVLPVNKKVRVRIIAKDVLHNFYLPHFKVKMDAIPGLPTYFLFEPTYTTEQYRQLLRKDTEWNEPYDAADPTGPKRWEKFEFELACAELCGKGHFSMRKLVKIVSEEEYNKWYAAQQSFYDQNIKGKDSDPFQAQNLAAEKIKTAKTAKDTSKQIITTTVDTVKK
jgi:cytochrome c oxidase subunit II